MDSLEKILIISGWFKSGKTLQETIEKLKIYGYTETETIEKVLNMHKFKILYTYPSKKGSCYRLTVQADKELDVGV